MHSFANFSFATINASRSLEIVKREIFFSYLPLSHIAERLLVEMCSLYTGSRVYFAESLETFSANLSYVSPTVFLGVPRIWTKFQQGILFFFLYLLFSRLDPKTDHCLQLYYQLLQWLHAQF